MAPPLHVSAVVLPDGEHREFWVHGGVVRAEPVRDAVELTAGPGTAYVVPGLVDAHCHVGLSARGAVDAAEQERQAVTEREAGVLLVRDCGSPADTRWIDGRADLPRIIRAGRHIARTARYLRGVAVEVEPEQLAATVADQAARGDGWVKLVGDWIDRSTGDLGPCWPDDALRAAVGRAHQLGARVAVHAFGEDALPGLLDAGVDCIEHGTGLSGALLERMASTGVAVVPTLVNIATFPDIAASAEAKFPRYAAHMRALHAGADDVVRAAVAAGVRVFAGTDAGGTLPHGLIAAEVAALHRAGMPAEAALGAASWEARAWLGRPSRLEEGSPADFLVLSGDPRVDLRVLAHPAAVVLDGEVWGERRAAPGPPSAGSAPPDFEL